MDIERRYFEQVELRAEMAGDDSKARIAGYAAVFNQRSDLIWGMFREVILPGAFADTIGRDDVRALWQHDTAQVLGRSSARTLSLAEDERGLGVEILPPDTQVGRDALISIARGDVTGMSFGFTVPPDGESWYEDVDGTVVRQLRSVKLWEVSPVTFPAYPQTEVGLRALFGPRPEIPAGLRGATGQAEAENRQRALLDVMRRRLELASL